MEILGIDIGGTGIKGGIVDSSKGQMITDRHRVLTPRPATPDAVGLKVKEVVDHFGWSGPMGVAFPARVKNGSVLIASNIDKDFVGMNITDLFSKQTGCPVSSLNDADAAGIAEMRFGAGQGQSGLALMITLGTGIGTALFNDGILVPNMEFGHVRMKSGKRGEKWAAASVRERKGLTWKDWAGRVQEYLAIMEFLIGPDLIILGGGVSSPERAAQFMPFLDTEAKLVPAKLGNTAGIVGAAVYAADKSVLSSNSLAGKNS